MNGQKAKPRWNLVAWNNMCLWYPGNILRQFKWVIVSIKIFPIITPTSTASKCYLCSITTYHCSELNMTSSPKTDGQAVLSSRAAQQALFHVYFHPLEVQINLYIDVKLSRWTLIIIKAGHGAIYNVNIVVRQCVKAAWGSSDSH